jgi:hypothetical protein
MVRPGHSQNKLPIGHQFQEHPAPQAYVSYSFSFDISPVKWTWLFLVYFRRQSSKQKKCHLWGLKIKIIFETRTIHFSHANNYNLLLNLTNTGIKMALWLLYWHYMVNSVATVQYLVITVSDPKQFDNIMFTNSCAKCRQQNKHKVLTWVQVVDR